jgi:hypothetical protein
VSAASIGTILVFDVGAVKKYKFVNSSRIIDQPRFANVACKGCWVAVLVCKNGTDTTMNWTYPFAGRLFRNKRRRMTKMVSKKTLIGWRWWGWPK